MTRAELKEILQKNSKESRRYYRLYPCLYRDLMLWDDYVQRIAAYRTKKYRAAMNFARYDVCADYGISEKSFYAIRRTLKELCEDLIF